MVGEIDAELRARGTPARAEHEKAYLKSAREHYGTSVPAIRSIAKAVGHQHPGMEHLDQPARHDHLDRLTGEHRAHDVVEPGQRDPALLVHPAAHPARTGHLRPPRRRHGRLVDLRVGDRQAPLGQREPLDRWAVAAGLVLGGTGSDTGGSIRGPLAYCGTSELVLLPKSLVGSVVLKKSAANFRNTSHTARK